MKLYKKLIEEVSPGFRLRPSLSGDGDDSDRDHGRGVSPGFRLRPSLSDLVCVGRSAVDDRVSPGFRLRPSLSAGDGAAS